jgi:hypothetical protein
MIGGISCWADEMDPLHGYCSGAGQCIDNGTNTPTTNNPPTDFGFTISPGPNSGDLLIDILVPNDEQNQPSYSITGTFSGSATLFGTTDWITGDLAAFLGILAAPADPIGAFLPSTQALDSTATGFSVYQLDAGTQTLQGPSNPGVWPLLNLGSPLPTGSYIVGFLNAGTDGWIATANSGAIFEDGNTPGGEAGTVPEPSSLVLFGSAALGVTFWLRRRACRRA